MKVPHIHGADDVRLDDVPTPHAGPRDVVLRVAAVGICGSDLAAAARGSIIPMQSGPAPLGHELSGVVAEVGSEVRDYRAGDRVVVNPLINMIGNGGPDGGFASHLLISDVVGRPASLQRIPDGLSLEHAALVEPLAVALHAINRVDAKAGETAAVFGVGPIGLACVLCMVQRGVKNIVVFDVSPLRRERALQLGASVAVDPRECQPAKVLAMNHGTAPMWGMQFPSTDVFIEASGAPGVVEGIIGFCGSGKRLGIVGAQKNPVAVDFTLVMAKELTIAGSLGYPEEFPAAIEMLMDKAVDVSPYVSHRFAADDFLKAFETAARPDQSAKVLVTYANA